MICGIMISLTEAI